MPQSRSASLLAIYPHITSRDRRLLQLLDDHQVLTTDQIHRMLFLARRTCQIRLGELAALGLLDRFRFARAGGGSQPWHWTLGHQGHRFQAAAHHRPEPTVRASRQGVDRLSANPNLTHLRIANEFFVRLTVHTRQHPQARLDRWWSETKTTKQFRTITADGHGLFSVAHTTVGFFLEADTGTEPLGRVVAKLDRYAQLIRRGGPRYPVLFWLGSEHREEHLHRLLRGRRDSVPLATATHPPTPPTRSGLLAAPPAESGSPSCPATTASPSRTTRTTTRAASCSDRPWQSRDEILSAQLRGVLGNPDRAGAVRSRRYGAASSFARTAARLSPGPARASGITHSPPPGRLVIHAPRPCTAASRRRRRDPVAPRRTPSTPTPARREHPAMPTPMPPSDQVVVTVCFAPGEDADWFAASEKVNDLLHADGTPARRYHVRHRRLIGWLTRFLGYYLLDAARRFGALTMAAGGRKGRLDLTGTAAKAANDAALRWRAWNTHIAATTRAAHPWEDYLAQHQADPTKLRLAEARRRFEQQPRVLAMLAFSFNPYELSVYQAGEATYVGLHWRIALIGDALITTDGRLLTPASDSVADRFRFLNEACGYLRSLGSTARLCAVAIA